MTDGLFVSHVLRVSDVDTAARFYAEVFGWTAADTPAGKLLRRGQEVVGSVSEVKPGVPAHWSSCVAVADVPAAARLAADGGGIVTTEGGEPVRVPGEGWLAPVLDPEKAIFLLVQDRPAAGAFGWHRLHAADPDAAAAFYQRFLPWTVDGGVVRLADGTAVADIVPAGGAPAHWLPFATVDDVAATVARATGLGATVRDGEPTVLTDPCGAQLALRAG